MTNRILAIIILSMLVGSHVAYAAQPTQEDKDVKKAQREEIIAEKKAVRDEKIATKKEEIAEKKISKMCERVEKTAARIQTQSQDREQKNLAKMEQRRNQIQEKRTMQNKELQERRMKRDQQRSQFYSEMMDLAQDDDQAAAVDTFQKTVEDAVQVRRNAIDVATEEMQIGVDALVDERVAYIGNLYEKYQSDEGVILEQAGAYCGEDATEDDLKNIAKSTNGDLKSAREAFKRGLQQQKGLNAHVQELAQVRKMAAQQAIDEFKRVIEQARMELRSSLGLDEVADMSDSEGVDMDEITEE